MKLGKTKDTAENIKLVLEVIIALAAVFAIINGIIIFYNNHLNNSQDPLIIIRDEKANNYTNYTEFLLNFSIINRRNENIILNSILFHMGGHIKLCMCFHYETIPIIFGQDVYISSNNIKYIFNNTLNGSMQNVNNTLTEIIMSPIESIITDKRVILDPHEQVDVRLKVNVFHPHSPNKFFMSLENLGGMIKVNFEDNSLKEGEVSNVWYERTEPNSDGIIYICSNEMLIGNTSI